MLENNSLNKDKDGCNKDKDLKKYIKKTQIISQVQIFPKTQVNKLIYNLNFKL